MPFAKEKHTDLLISAFHSNARQQMDEVPGFTVLKKQN